MALRHDYPLGDADESADRLKCPGDSWKQYLSESRLQKAEALLEERKRRNQNLELIDCLQISDKGQIIARNEELRCLTQDAIPATDANR